VRKWLARIMPPAPEPEHEYPYPVSVKIVFIASDGKEIAALEADTHLLKGQVMNIDNIGLEETIQ
jgi:hypothetical protein